MLDNHTEEKSEDGQNIDMNQNKHARDKRRRCLRIKRPNNHGKYSTINYLISTFYAINLLIINMQLIHLYKYQRTNMT